MNRQSLDWLTHRRIPGNSGDISQKQVVEGGIGSGDSEACKAFKAIKKMICDHIALATFDEASAADGSCPLEQIADASGIAVGGTVLQMSRDMSRMKVLSTHSRSLTPARRVFGRRSGKRRSSCMGGRKRRGA